MNNFCSKHALTWVLSWVLILHVLICDTNWGHCLNYINHLSIHVIYTGNWNFLTLSFVSVCYHIRLILGMTSWCIRQASHLLYLNEHCLVWPGLHIYDPCPNLIILIAQAHLWNLNGGLLCIGFCLSGFTGVTLFTKTKSSQHVVCMSHIKQVYRWTLCQCQVASQR